MRRLHTLALGLLVTACASPATPLPRSGFRVAVAPIAGDSLLLTLMSAPRSRINARLLPALEGGRDTLRFTGTPDSLGDYFASAPALRVSRATLRPGAAVAAGICDDGSAVCHVLREPVPELR